MKQEYIIRTDKLGKRYGSQWAVRQIDIHVPAGQIYGLLGRNGAGKTTIMKMLLGLTKQSSGSIFLFRQEVTKYEEDIYCRIGSSIETPGFYPNMTAKENLSVFSRLRGKTDYRRIQNALDVVGLPYHGKKVFAEYSLGMKQRLAIANAMMNEPELLILDEPTNGLDPIGIAQMRTLLKELSHNHGKTILISSHQLSEMEQLVDWVGIIHEGKMLEECSYQELKEKEHPYIRLKTAPLEQACQYLSDVMHINHFTVKDGTIFVHDLKYSTLDINQKLFSAGIGVSEITICRDNLENHFKELTGGIGIA